MRLVGIDIDVTVDADEAYAAKDGPLREDRQNLSYYGVHF